MQIDCNFPLSVVAFKIHLFLVVGRLLGKSLIYLILTLNRHRYKWMNEHQLQIPTNALVGGSSDRKQKEMWSFKLAFNLLKRRGTNSWTKCWINYRTACRISYWTMNWATSSCRYTLTWDILNQLTLSPILALFLPSDHVTLLFTLYH